VWSRILRGFEGNPRRVEDAASLLLRLGAASLCALVAATWPLWSPGREFPRVPFVGWFLGIADRLEWIALAAGGVALLVTLIFGVRHSAGRRAVGLSTLAIVLLVLADQHRLQPWVYQLVVLELVVVSLPAAEAIAIARLFVASIYFFSALSKLDRSFFDAGGGQIADGLIRCFALSNRISDDGRLLLAGTVAVGELFIALGLCWRRTRRVTWPASIAMHLALVATLGPWGAASKPGVLLWNVYFALQNAILFGLAGEQGANDSIVAPVPPRCRSVLLCRAVRAMAIFAILFPLTEPFGICDVWPAWAVYATGPERLRVFVKATDRDRLAPSVRRYLEEPRFEDDLCLVRIDRWSLDACWAPLYPQNRFRLGVAMAITDESGRPDAVVVETESAANRLTGKRVSRRLEGRPAIVEELRSYWLNGFPREQSQ
jgi:hypothetical protein